MVKHTQTVHRQQPTNCLSMFDHFVGLALKELTYVPFEIIRKPRLTILTGKNCVLLNSVKVFIEIEA